MGRQLGHQPVGDRLDTLVFLGLIRRRLRACDHARTVMLGSRRDRRLVGRIGLGVVLRGDRRFVLGADIAALDAQGARAVDADEGASAGDLFGIEDLRGDHRRRQARSRSRPSRWSTSSGSLVGFGVGLLQTVSISACSASARRLLIAR